MRRNFATLLRQVEKKQTRRAFLEDRNRRRKAVNRKRNRAARAARKRAR